MFIFRDITMVFAGAFAFGLLFWRLRQPLILGYVFAGLILSPLTPGPRIHDVHTFEIMAEVGVILLMFSVGIEFSIPELLGVKWVALIGAPIGISLSIGLGVGGCPLRRPHGFFPLLRFWCRCGHSARLAVFSGRRGGKERPAEQNAHTDTK